MLQPRRKLAASRSPIGEHGSTDLPFDCRGAVRAAAPDAFADRDPRLCRDLGRGTAAPDLLRPEPGDPPAALDLGGAPAARRVAGDRDIPRCRRRVLIGADLIKANLSAT